MMEKSKRDRWLALPNQRAWKEELQKLLCRSDAAVESALVRLYDFQSPLERAVASSVSENGVGFNRVDAKVLSKYAYMVKFGHHLTKNEVYFVRARILKYWKQLMVLSKQKLQQERAEEEARNASSSPTDSMCPSDSTSDSDLDRGAAIHDIPAGSLSVGAIPESYIISTSAD